MSKPAIAAKNGRTRSVAVVSAVPLAQLRALLLASPLCGEGAVRFG